MNKEQLCPAGNPLPNIQFSELDNEWNMIWKFDDDSMIGAHREKHCIICPSSRVALPPRAPRDFPLPPSGIFALI